MVPRLPRSVLWIAGIVAGLAAYAFGGRARRASLRNLAAVLPMAGERTLQRFARRAFVHAAWSYIETFALPALSREHVIASYSVAGWEHLEEALAAGRGVIMVSAHVGSPVAAGQVLAVRGVPTSVVVEPIQPPRLFHLMTRVRGSFGLRFIPSDRSAVRDIVRALRQNEVVGMMCDRDVAGTGMPLAFFGKETSVTTAPATLALRTGAAMLPAVAYRTGLFAGAARIDPPIDIPTSGSHAANVRELTARVTQRIESLIRAHPEQWAVFEDIWPYGTMPRT
ncbi:MAG TPA: lysophospholipid acyltransferase family protein [Chloroflexota bacterium]|nr:lysophospholipid acyltransferase family protein [Chloroflexota bacterium]